MYRKLCKCFCSFVMLCLIIAVLPLQVAAAEADDLVAAKEDERIFELWYGRMEEIVNMFRAWSSSNGVTDGNGYCTTDGQPFGIATGDRCYIGSVTSSMKKAGFIDYTVPGGWSCNGFARFSMHALYGRTFWRSEMTENVYTLSMFSSIKDVQDFLDDSQTRIGDMLCIMGFADFDGDGKVNDEYWHYMMFIRYDDEGVMVMDGNFDHQNGVSIHLVTWEFLMSRQWIYLYHISDKDYKYINGAEQIIDPSQARGGNSWYIVNK